LKKLDKIRKVQKEIREEEGGEGRVCCELD
jgi:hypothetical protein